MDREKLKKYGFIGLTAGLVLAIFLVILISTSGGKKEKPVEPQNASAPSEEPIVRYVTKTETKYVDKIVPVEVEKQITTDILEEGLRDMGELVTEEYLFKEVTTFESQKVFAWVLKADSKLVMGYEGTLLAGIDFTKIQVEKLDSYRKIHVTLPKAEILSCDLDLDSFEVYEEDVSRWNPITASDYNGSLKELEEKAECRALERGILERASANAEQLIKNFINSLLGAGEYEIDFK